MCVMSPASGGYRQACRAFIGSTWEKCSTSASAALYSASVRIGRFIIRWSPDLSVAFDMTFTSSEQDVPVAAASRLALIGSQSSECREHLCVAIAQIRP